LTPFWLEFDHDIPACHDGSEPLEGFSERFGNWNLVAREDPEYFNLGFCFIPAGISVVST